MPRSCNVQKARRAQKSTPGKIAGKGIYTLILKLDSSRKTAVGSLGEVEFCQGYYAYTGSARGPGGFRRVQRHKQLISGSSKVRRWHIDYLMPQTSLKGVVATETSEDLECEIAQKIGGRLIPVRGFGSTDCSCPGHLHFSARLSEMTCAVRDAHFYLAQGKYNCHKIEPKPLAKPGEKAGNST
jgi:endonuclease-3